MSSAYLWLSIAKLSHVLWRFLWTIKRNFIAPLNECSAEKKVINFFKGFPNTYELTVLFNFFCAIRSITYVEIRVNKLFFYLKIYFFSRILPCCFQSLNNTKNIVVVSINQTKNISRYIDNSVISNENDVFIIRKGTINSASNTYACISFSQKLFCQFTNSITVNLL